MSVIKKISFGAGQQNPFFLMSSNLSSHAAHVNSQQNLQQNPPQNLPQNSPQNLPQNSKDSGFPLSDKNVAYVTSGLALVALGVSTVAVINSARRSKGSESNELINKFNEGLNALKNEVNEFKLKSDIDSKIEEKFQKLSERIKNGENEFTSVRGWFDNWIKALDDSIKDKSTVLEERINGISSRVSEMFATERNIVKIDGFNLLQNITTDGKRLMIPDKTVKEIEGVASKIIHEGMPIPKLDKNSTVWSLTMESIPEKEGGLGEVPTQIAKNMTDLGINNYLVRPINEIPGISSIISKDGKWHYKYKDLNMDVDKITEFEIYAFRNGRTEKELVEVFVGKDPNFGFKRLMFKNEDYFGAISLYKDSQRASEKERCAFLVKSIYEFAKIKLDPQAKTSYKIFNEAMFNETPAPDVMLLNDWHVAAMPGMTKLLAPVESAMGELSKPAAEKLKNMNMVELIHNADYQGQDWHHVSDIMNTLYGKYAYDIYTHAKTGLEPNGLKNIHVIDRSVNLANVSAALANKLKPVSPTYGMELGAEFERGHSLQHIFQKRIDKKTMQGQSNGWDKVVNEVSAKNVNQFNNNLNLDKFKILKDGIDALNLTEKQKKDIKEIFVDPKDKSKTINFRYDNMHELLKALRELEFDALTKFLDKMDEEGVTKLRTFKPAVASDDIDTIMEVRRYNKAQFINLMKSMLEYNKTHPGFYNFASEGVTDLSKVDMEHLDDQIVMNCGTRFVGQKGIDILAETMKQVMEEWSERYPGKPKPIIVAGGADGESGQWEALMRRFKTEMGEKADTVPYMVGFTPNNVFHSGSDITLFPSHFEPDGSKWESLYKGTPVVATRCGGHIDSIADGYNGYLTERTVPEVRQSGYDYLGTMVYDFKNALYRACDDFFNNKDKWKEMVRHSIDGEESWLIKDKDGKFVGGSLLGHIEDLGFNLDDFSQIANADARKAFAGGRISASKFNAEKKARDAAAKKEAELKKNDVSSDKK